MQQVELKPQGPPAEPTFIKVEYEGNMVPAEVFLVREQSYIQEYALIKAPYTREFTRVSMVKTKQYPIPDINIDPLVRKWFR